VAERRNIPRPRHLFPETAAFFIGLRRTALYFGFGSRAAVGRIPIWIAGSLAGITCIMLTISLFFLREQAVAAVTPTPVVAPVEVIPQTVLPVPVPSYPNLPYPNFEQPAAKLTMLFERTEFPFLFDELTPLTQSSLNRTVTIPTLAGRDLWQQRMSRAASMAAFSPWLEFARQLPVTLSGLAASNQVPLQLAPDADRDLGLLIRKSPIVAGTPGEPVKYEIHLINISLKTIEQVIIREKISELHRVTEVLPSAHLSDNDLVWTLNSLEPGMVKRLTVTLIPEVAGEIQTETLVLPTTRLSATVNVRAPAPPKTLPPVQIQPEPIVAGAPLLKLTYTELRALRQGDILSLTFSVTNAGTAAAEDVQLYVRLSGEFEHRYGEYVHHRVGRLEPGQTRRALLQATAKAFGNARLSTSLTMQGTETEARELKIPIAAKTAPSSVGAEKPELSKNSWTPSRPLAFGDFSAAP